MKKKLCIALAASLMLNMGLVFADELKGTLVEQNKDSFTLKLSFVKTPNITVDGEEKKYSPAPFEENDRFFVPLRAILEDNGFIVNYDDETESIFAINTEKNDMLAMQLNNTRYSFNNESYSFDVTPVLRNDRTFVPVRIIYEMLGYNVDFDEETNTAVITSK